MLNKKIYSTYNNATNKKMSSSYTITLLCVVIILELLNIAIKTTIYYKLADGLQPVVALHTEIGVLTTEIKSLTNRVKLLGTVGNAVGNVAAAAVNSDAVENAKHKIGEWVGNLANRNKKDL